MGKTQALVDKTQNRLSTGLSVAHPRDGAVRYFQAKSLDERAKAFMDRKSSINQGISSLEATLKAMDSLEQLTNQAIGIFESARSAGSTQRAEFENQLTELAKQIEKIVHDTSYQGLNLLNSSASKLSVRFSEMSESKLEVDGVDFKYSTFFQKSDGSAFVGTYERYQLGSRMGMEALLSEFNFDDASQLASFNAMADLAVARLEQTKTYVQSKAASLANSLAILRVRSDFSQEYINTLEGGAEKLTVADLNQEGANMLALQTRQQLGIQALSFAGQSEQSILGLFR